MRNGIAAFFLHTIILFIPSSEAFSEETLPEVSRIREYLDKNETSHVLKEVDSILSRPASDFDNVTHERYNRSLAYFGRSIVHERNRNIDAQYTDLLTASRLGLTEAAERAVSFVRDFDLSKDSENYKRTVRMLASLGNSQEMYNLATETNLSRSEEKSYWTLLVVAASFNDNDVKQWVANNYHQVSASTAQFGLTKVKNTTSIQGLPSKGLIAVAVNDMLVRQGLNLQFYHASDGNKVGTNKTVKENFIDIRDAYRGKTKNVDAYLIVASAKRKRSGNIIFDSKKNMIDELAAGDIAFVRCGPLSHMATVYSVDRENDSIDFVDPIYQFWQPTHNSCISSFSFRDIEFGRSLVRVSFREVAQITEAFSTIR